MKSESSDSKSLNYMSGDHWPHAAVVLGTADKSATTFGSLLGLSVADYWKPKHYIFDKDAQLSQNGQKQPPGGEA